MMGFDVKSETSGSGNEEGMDNARELERVDISALNQCFFNH